MNTVKLGAKIMIKVTEVLIDVIIVLLDLSWNSFDKQQQVINTGNINDNNNSNTVSS